LDEVGLDTLQDQCSISQSRMSLLPYAGEVLTELLDVFEPKDIAISSYGLREGLLYQQMSDDIRARDPLIEACKVSEMKDARVPGMGKTIFNFVRPLFYDASAELLRIVRAACLLHDVSWRAHPDYRAEVCFDNATRANLGGLKHSERMFLALALMHRYTNKRDDEIFSWMFRVIDATEVKTAEILGKAMRLGAMLWVSDGGQRAELKWDPKNEELTLLLPGDTSALYGEVAETRLQSLSQALNAKNYNVVT
jgi:exopolyphosphatase/guanosine-5'-triphosphate,3'-diphosphate pyrophosphatase